MQKLPNAHDLFGAIAVCDHLWMKSEDDPEARIRQLEQPLADSARVSETGVTPPPGKWAPPSGPPIAPPPLPYSGSFGPTLQTSSRGRTWWILAAVFVIGMIALPAGILLFTAHQVSRSGLTTLLPTPGISTISPTPSGATTQTPTAGPSTSPSAVPTAPAGENQSISGISENQTIACSNSTVSISGVSNTVVITGHCASLSVSGVQNKVTVEAVDSIETSGFNNQITYHSGSPSIDKSGEGNVVQQG
jgi:Protein of unknown function (DUF3060)